MGAEQCLWVEFLLERQSSRQGFEGDETVRKGREGVVRRL